LTPCAGSILLQTRQARADPQAGLYLAGWRLGPASELVIAQIAKLGKRRRQMGAPEPVASYVGFSRGGH
jgi:hypothetical protein